MEQLYWRLNSLYSKHDHCNRGKYNSYNYKNLKARYAPEDTLDTGFYQISALELKAKLTSR